MKLTELNPEWIWSKGSKVGMTFKCPHCREILIGVYFKNPIGDEKAVDMEQLWERRGDTFDMMTLSPSVDANKLVQPKESITLHGEGHWHGHITNGEVV